MALLESQIAIRQAPITIVQVPIPVPERRKDLGPGVRIQVLQETDEEGLCMPVFEEIIYQNATLRSYEKKIAQTLSKARKVAGALAVNGFEDATLETP